MLSGDNQTVAEAIGAQIGIDETRAPLMPDGKVKMLKTLSESGGVAVIGDGSQRCAGAGVPHQLVSPWVAQDLTLHWKQRTWY